MAHAAEEEEVEAELHEGEDEKDEGEEEAEEDDGVDDDELAMDPEVSRLNLFLQSVFFVSQRTSSMSSSTQMMPLSAHL